MGVAIESFGAETDALKQLGCTICSALRCPDLMNDHRLSDQISHGHATVKCCHRILEYHLHRARIGALRGAVAQDGLAGKLDDPLVWDKSSQSTCNSRLATSAFTHDGKSLPGKDIKVYFFHGVDARLNTIQNSTANIIGDLEVSHGKQGLYRGINGVDASLPHAWNTGKQLLSIRHFGIAK